MFKPNVNVNQAVCLEVGQHQAYGIALGFTALHICVSRKTTLPALVSILIDAGADVNMKDHLGYSVLHLAAMKGDVKITKLLLNTNVTVDAMNDKHQTPLMLACQKAFSPAVCHLLCKNGASVEATCLHGKTPLHYAAKAYEVIYELHKSSAQLAFLQRRLRKNKLFFSRITVFFGEGGGE